MSIRPMQPDDWAAVRAIYAEGIATEQATFELEVPTWEAWDANHLPDCRLVYEREGTVVAWAALGRVSSRRVYVGVAEVSIYVSAKARGTGIGKILLGALVESSEHVGFWTLMAGIFLENVASTAIHRACGFREIGYRERVGKLNGEWKDVLLLERRSKVVGID
ncbi:MAG: GNAT family N-acetyltransferase [Phototrophicaceae bacterium]